MRRELETILRDDALALRWMPGDTGRLVVVFAGMKRGVGGEHPAEFVGSAGMAGDAALFVTDRRSTWYAAPGLWRRILTHVRHVRMTERIGEVLALGSSMGGWGAMLLARDMPVRRVLAFSPQVSMDRAELDDPRWPAIGSFGAAPPATSLAGALRADTHYTVVASEGCLWDRRQASLLRKRANVRRLHLPGQAHNTAARLKAAGILAPFVTAVLSGAVAEASALIRTLKAPEGAEETP